MNPADAAPAALLAVVFALIELVKYVSRRRGNGVSTSDSALARIEIAALEGNRRLEMILHALQKDREHRIKTDTLSSQTMKRMEDHMEKMECRRSGGK